MKKQRKHQFDMKYDFTPPENIRECHLRIRRVQRDIRNVEKQLGDKRKRPISADQYHQWRRKATGKLVYLQEEYRALVDWRRKYRMDIEARRVDIFDPEDPRQIMLRLIETSEDHLEDPDDDTEEDLRTLLRVAENYLMHDGR